MCGVRLWKAFSISTLLGALVSSCVFGPSEERLNCLQRCAEAKDACILEAQSAPAIQSCDAQNQSCSATCPGQ